MKSNILKLTIGLALAASFAVATVGCSGGGQVSKEEANKPAPPANEKTIPSAPTSTQAK